jgi:CPA1 family monovalent cation:H+ antiporter
VHSLDTAGTLVLLFCISTAVAIAVRRVRIPFTVALVIVGLALGALGTIAPPRLTKDLLFTIFLPGLLFEAAFHLDLGAFRRTWRTILALAVPGVAVAIAVMAGILAGVSGLLHDSSSLAWESAVLLGAIVAATDPVAVTAVFREVKVPVRLATLVEGESLLNDGTGVVFFSLALAYATGQASSAGALAGEFVLVAGGGVVVGIISGVIASMVIRRVDEPMIEIALTMIAAYGPFVLAEKLGVSGVLATVCAGALCGQHGRDGGMSSRSRAAAESFWEYLAFALNSIVFLLIGFTFKWSSVAAVLPEVIIAFIAMSLARAALVSATLAVQRRGNDPLPRRWTIVVAWGGLRGALSMVLALALPEELPARDVIVATTVGLVVLSIVFQGASMPLLVQRLGLGAPPDSTVS